MLYARKRGSPPDPLTVDHKPGSDSERERIIAAGATVEQKTCEQAGCLCFSAKVTAAPAPPPADRARAAG